MSWFDTTKIASMATKAMKEAQKTLDTALDIKEDETDNNPDQESLWAGWKMPKSDSESKLSEKSSNMSSSLWGSFSGSFIEAGSVGDKSEVVTQAPRSQETPVSSLTSPVTVDPGHSSVLGGDSDRNQDIEATLATWTEADQEKFAR